MKDKITQSGDFSLTWEDDAGELYGETVRFQVGDTLEDFRYQVEMAIVSLFSKLAENQGIDPNASGANECWFPPGDL